MSAISDHCDVIRSWLNFEYTDNLITSWTRMAEEALSEDLRCKHMIAIDTGFLVEQRVTLPEDWLELDFVRLVDGPPLTYSDRHDFYTGCNKGKYTLTGNYLIVGGDVDDGLSVEISYYEQIPPLGEDSNWLMTYYSRLYVSGTLSAASAYGLDDSRAVMWEAATQKLVDRINENHTLSKTSGSALILNTHRSKKGFG